MRPLPALAPLALAWLLSGCGQDAGVLARVNQQTITLEQFNEVARGNVQQYAGSSDSVKTRLLNDLMDRELLVQGALSERMDQTPEFQRYRRTFERQMLRETLFQRLLGGPFPVSDAEVREIYARRAIATRARLIFAYDESIARQAARDLARGEAFTAVADRYNPTGMVPPGGDIGFIQAGAMLPPLDNIVRTGTPGRIVGPVAGGDDGWFIVRIEERRPEPQPPLEEIRAQLGEMLRQRKQRMLVSRVVDRLRVEYQVEVQPGAAQAMSEKLRPIPGDTPAPRTPPEPGPEDRKLALARYQGGAYTLGDAYDDLVGGAANRLDLAVIPSVERWIRAQTIERAALIEAHRCRIDEEPELQRRLRDRLNNTLLDGYYQRQVIARVRVEPEDLRAAYQRYKPSFVRLKTARVVSVTLDDSAAATALAAQAGHAPSLKEAAAIAALGGRVADEKLTFPADSPVWTQFESHLTAMSPGEIAGPLRTASGWFIFQLREKQQEAPPFENLTAGARGQLQGVAVEVKREARLRALTDSLRQAFSPIVVYSERLRRLPWPPAPVGPPGT